MYLSAIKSGISYNIQFQEVMIEYTFCLPDVENFCAFSNAVKYEYKPVLI
ncbi:Uncharacterized protein dnm_063760 [Desulfonema magnum]|uniref:Uncharacterized protein n=1 Tax=Desulfonema magnum TaxID=45655 RepID=A0A975GQW3_9BACT|nr:Uncharacterized protein dnm_063760 [Desulfonema magnum]